MTYFGQFADDPHFMTAEEEQRELDKQRERYPRCVKCGRSYADHYPINQRGACYGYLSYGYLRGA